MSSPVPTRDEIAARYLDSLPYPPYKVQEDALLAWFACESGVLVTAPTGTGKTLIAEGALFEALHTRRRAYYTTPLIALTDQKFAEIQRSAQRWGFSPDDVGLVTGNRKVNPDATVLIVVAEILLNRLLHPEAFDFSDVASVTMDEFHSFADPERGVVWELSLALLPKHVRTLLLSATVGNAVDFSLWLNRAHGRRLDLVQSTERKVPLSFHWIGDELLNDQLESMAQGPEQTRYTPALVFCFNRDECWNVADQIKGKSLLAPGQQERIDEAIEPYDWSQGAGPKLKPLLLRGVGVHHAGVLPKYRRIVEELFEKKLLSICACTETLAAGVNLPARSIVLPTLLKGPPDKKKLIEASAAHQIFGRAGRPQFDTQGHVFALAHEDDVKIARWREKYDQIPEDTKDFAMLAAKKALKKKMPTRRTTEQYWSQQQFEQLRVAPAGKLASRGPLPWRLLAHMLAASPDVKPLRDFAGKRLFDGVKSEQGQRQLDRMLLTMADAGFVTLEPPPPPELCEPNPFAELLKVQPTPTNGATAAPVATPKTEDKRVAFGAGLFDEPAKPAEPTPIETPPEETAPASAASLAASLTFGRPSAGKPSKNAPNAKSGAKAAAPAKPVETVLDLRTGMQVASVDSAEPPAWSPKFARPTPELEKIRLLRSVHPLYGLFLVSQLGVADRCERLQAIESVLDLPRSLLGAVRVPPPEELPFGPLATTRINPLLLQTGLATEQELVGATEEERRDRRMYDEPPPRALTLADKLRRLFQARHPDVTDVSTTPVWVANEALDFGRDFNKYVTSKRLQRQEGIVFRHLLRLILLLKELREFTPPDCPPEAWRGDLDEVSDRLTTMCRLVDPTSTDEALAQSDPLASM